MNRFIDFDDEEEILFTDILEKCIIEKNFSCAWLQKTFELPYPLAGRFLDACQEMGVIEKYHSENVLVSVQEYYANKDKYIEVLIKYGLF